MATNGQINTNTTYESYFWVRWSIKSQNIAENYTTINWSCGVMPGHKFSKNAIRMSAFTINGVQVYSGGTYSDILDYQEHTLGSGELNIPHNTDGTKTFTISSFTGWLYSNHNYSSNGGSFTLTTIPRKATITAAYDFTDQGSPRLSFSNPGGFPIDVWLEPNPIGTHLCERVGIANTGSYTWSLSASERDQLRNSCAGRECTIRIGLYTHIGNELHADYRDMKFTMTENTATMPAVSMKTTLVNSLIPNVFDGLYIQGKSKVRVELSANGKYGASIKSYSVKIQGSGFGQNYISANVISDVIPSAGSVKITGSAKDSREFTGSDEQTITVIAYSKPLVIPLGSENAILCYRSDGNGNRTGNSTSLWIKAKRSYHDVESRNKCALEWRSKLVSEEWSDDHEWLPLLAEDSTSNEYNALVPGTFNLKESYAVQIRAKDTIGEEDIKTFEIPTQDVALHLGKGGKNVSIGTYCDYSEERTFYSDWKAIFDKEVFIGGSQVADHIVERGTGGIWTYEKLASGIARCWAKIDYTADLAGVGVRSYVRIGKGFPVTFKSVPFCNCTLANQTTWNHILSSVDFTESMVVAISVYRLGEGVDVTAGGTADIMVIGYWK